MVIFVVHERKWFFALSSLIFISLVIASVLIFQPPLEKIHKIIKSDYQSVSHISASQFLNLDPRDVVVFDVREVDEFDVSHIDGAIQVMPDIEAAEFIDEYGELLDGKRVIFYCSVGRRSSDLASRLGSAPIKLGAKSSQNLIGGVFTWANQDRELYGATQRATKQVHPYNEYWGRLVRDQTKLSYTPN